MTNSENSEEATFNGVQQSCPSQTFHERWERLKRLIRKVSP